MALILGLACASSFPRDPKLTPVAPLPDALKECSGFIELGDGLYAGNNDSGNPAELYLFRLGDTGKARPVKIKNATNYDWEEMASDDQFVYISDTGNNSGNRKDLAIYKVKKADLLQKEEVFAEKIALSYPKQKTFEPSNKHNFDCEAMVSVGDSLYLFTKNRGNSRTDLYSIPKSTGTYIARYLDSYAADGLITGAAYSADGDTARLALIGYTVEGKGYHPFILYFPRVKGTSFFESGAQRIPFEGKLQTETISFHDAHSVYITNEEEHGDQGFVYQVILEN
jgi:hypothetical protein